MADTVEFDAVIEAARAGGALVRLPRVTAEVFGTRARFAVHVTFNGVPYRGSTMPLGDGTFCVGMRKDIRKEAGADVGDTVHVVLRRDTKETTVDLPAELARALDRSAEAAEAFSALSYTHRREHAEYVAEARRPETRESRAEQTVRSLVGRKSRER